MASQEHERLEVEAAVKRAVSGIVTVKAAACKNYDAAEGRSVVKYLKECKKKISSELDEAIKTFENWR